MKRNVTANYSENIVIYDFKELTETLISTADLVRVKGKAILDNSLTIREVSTGYSYNLSYGEETPLLDGSQGIYCIKDIKEKSVLLTITEYTFTHYSEIGNGLEQPSKLGKFINQYTWPTKPSAEEFGVGIAWFNDIESIAYSDGNDWKNPINSVHVMNDNISNNLLFQTFDNIITSKTNYYETQDNHSLTKIITSTGIL